MIRVKSLMQRLKTLPADAEICLEVDGRNAYLKVGGVRVVGQSTSGCHSQWKADFKNLAVLC